MIELRIDSSGATAQEIAAFEARPGYLAFKRVLERFGCQRGIALGLVASSTRQGVGLASACRLRPAAAGS